MQFDSVLARDDTQDVVAEVEALASERRLTGRGVVQSRGGLRQFQFAVDEREHWWVIAFDDGDRSQYSNGIVRFGNDAPRAAEFFSLMPEPLQMLWPTRLLTWANAPGGFYPVLIQRLGRRSLLFTFEHVDDPAMRQTLVIDETTGIARKLIGYDRGLILTSLGELGDWDAASEPVFEPITDWIRSDY